MTGVRVLIRTDSSYAIGTGHLSRCLTFAQRLRDAGARLTFACRNLSGAALEPIRDLGFELRIVKDAALREDADSEPFRVDWTADALAVESILSESGIGVDAVVVDHYGLDARWEQRIRRVTGRIMAIDDLADREHACDLLVDQNFYSDMQRRYEALVPASCRLFLGPQYSFLRPEFYRLRKALRPRSGKVKRILVSFGGVDRANVTRKAIDALQALPARMRTELTVDVLIGASNPNRRELVRHCKGISWINAHIAPEDVAGRMAEADLAIGAGGITVWERCCVGLPALVMTLAANQEGTVAALHERGCILSIGRAHETTVEHLARAIEHLLSDPEMVYRLGQASFGLLGNDPETNAEALAHALLD